MEKNKNKYGQYFTKPDIAKFMVSRISKDTSASILEPCCGEGVFLKQLKEANFYNLNAIEIDKTLSCDFEFVKYKSFVTEPTSNKYDVIIGNPPYIRWKNLDADLKQELNQSILWNTYFNSLCDYLFIFILKSIEQLNEEGELIFICPEYWMNTTHSYELRNYMCSNGYIEELYSFKEVPLFEGVASSIIVFKYRKSKRINKTISFYKFNKKGFPTLQELLSFSCFDDFVIPQFELNKRWVLADEETQKKIATFETACKKNSTKLFDESDDFFTIGDFCDIGNGMVSGLDKAFRMDVCENLTSAERANLLRVFKAKDMSQYYNKSESRYIFINQDMDEETFKSSYPNFYEQLKSHQRELDKRYQYNKVIPYWKFVFPRNYNLFSKGEKSIFIPCKERISHKKFVRFCLAESDVYPLQDVTAIYKKENCKESIEYLLAFLNNERVFHWITLKGIIKGEIVEFSEAPISSIPYRPINWQDQHEVDLHNSITDGVIKYIKTKDSSHLEIINYNFDKLLS